MRQLGYLVAAIVLALSCAATPPTAPIGAIPLRSDVYVQSITPGVWRHVSYLQIPGAGYVPSNGLIVRSSQGAVVVDTAWTSEQTGSILDWVQAHVGPATGLVVTHAHQDRLGGLSEVQRRRVPSYALAETVELAAKRGWPPIEHSVSSGFALDSLGVSGELFFPGPAHTVDNATVWLRETRVLVGGCLVRASAANTMGNTSDGDLESWPRAIAALQKRYPDVLVVVPGHGDPGGPELLVHTRDLLGN